MPRKPLILLLSCLVVAPLLSAQTGGVIPPPTVDQGMTPQSMDVATPDQVGDADPLDVLESQPEEFPIEPTVPQFTEIPEPSAEPPSEAQASDAPAPETPLETPPEIAMPEPAPAIPVKKAEVKKAAVPIVINNDPDVRRESRFHNIYKKYNEQPTSDELWEAASGARKAEVYQVQKGDTLWDLSNTLFADPNYWPKIWSLNVGNIGNPHEINSQMNIQFFPGTMSDAPTLGLVDKPESEVAAETPLVQGSDDLALIPKIKKKTPLLKTIPGSIPRYHVETKIPVPTIIDFPSLRRQYSTPTEYLSYYVANRFPETVGTVIETELGVQTAMEYQYVIVRLNSSVSDKKFIVIKEMGKVKDPDSILRNAALIEVQGSIEIIEKVTGNGDLYRAIVRKNLQPVAVGSQLLTGSLPTFDPGTTALASGIKALIIGGEYHNHREQYQSNMIVFLNAGSSQGVREGQSFPVYSNIRNRNPATRARINDRRVGTVKVIRVADSFSTAYVTGIGDDIFVGDHVGLRNSENSASGTDIDSNTDISKASEKDLVPPIEDSLELPDEPESETTFDDSDFELE